MQRCVSLCVEQNLTPVVSFILLGPRDTEAMVRETLALACRLFEQGAEIACTEMLIPYPGTPIQSRLARDGKFRRSEQVYYFESYNGMDTKRILRLFARARRAARLVHGGEPLASQRRVYREFRYFDDLLAGRIPDGFESYLAGLGAGSPEKKEGEQLLRDMLCQLDSARKCERSA
jgi:hypothetical protein